MKLKNSGCERECQCTFFSSSHRGFVNAYYFFKGGHFGDLVRGAGTRHRVDMVLPRLVFKKAETAFRVVALHEATAEVVDFQSERRGWRMSDGL